MDRDDISKLIQGLFELELDMYPNHSPSEMFAENLLANLEQYGVELGQEIERVKTDRESWQKSYSILLEASNKEIQTLKNLNAILKEAYNDELYQRSNKIADLEQEVERLSVNLELAEATIQLQNLTLKIEE